MAYISEFTRFNIGDKVFMISDDGARVHRMTIVSINFNLTEDGNTKVYTCAHSDGVRSVFDESKLHSKADEAFREWDNAHRPKVEPVPEVLDVPEVVCEQRVIDPLAERDSFPVEVST